MEVRECRTLGEGDFFGTGEHAIAQIVFDTADSTYKAVILRPAATALEEIHILDSDVDPTRMFVRAVPPGSYPVSRIIWKHGGPQKIFLPYGGIELGTYESAARVFYWDDASSRFVEQWMSD